MKPGSVIRKLREGKIILVVSKAETVLKNNLKILKGLVKECKGGLFIIISQPYQSFKRILERNQINFENVFFIDMISATKTSRPERSKDCIYINAPTHLTDLGVAISQSLELMGKGKKFLFIDNLSTFLIYNEPVMMSEFTHFLVNQMKIHDVIGVLISIHEELGTEFINKIQNFCDEIVKLS